MTALPCLLPPAMTAVAVPTEKPLVLVFSEWQDAQFDCRIGDTDCQLSDSAAQRYAAKQKDIRAGRAIELITLHLVNQK